MEKPNSSIDLLLDPDFHATGSPHAIWSWMRKNKPIYRHPQSELPSFWSVTRYKDIRDIYSNPQTFSSSKGVLLRPLASGPDPGSGITLALTDPPQHKKMRNIMAKWFTMPYARSLEDIIRNKICELLAKSMKKDSSDFTQDVAARLALFVTCYILGVPEMHHEDIFHWTHESFVAGKSLALHRDFMLFFADLMDERIRNPQDDLASAIATSMPDNKPLAETAIILNYENLLGATENAGLSMANGVLTLLQHPAAWKKIHHNRELIPSATNEILRWSSSATHSMRTVMKEIDFNGYHFKPNERVVVWLPSANRDETIFKNPDKFNIERSPNPHLALGYGKHFCIGNALARVQMRLLLTELMDMPYTLRLNGEPTRERSIYVNGPTKMLIKFIKKDEKLLSNKNAELQTEDAIYESIHGCIK